MKHIRMSSTKTSPTKMSLFVICDSSLFSFHFSFVVHLLSNVVQPKRDIFVGTFVFRDIIKKTKQGRDKIEGVLEKETFSCITLKNVNSNQTSICDSSHCMYFIAIYHCPHYDF